jgi:glycine/D-amino acid oxidase-like deaminating enzyme
MKPIKVLVLGAGPIGTGVAVSLLEYPVNAQVVLVDEPWGEETSWPLTRAYPAAAGYGQPFRATGLDISWWKRTRKEMLLCADRNSSCVQRVKVEWVHSRTRHDGEPDWAYRPDWAQAVATENLHPLDVPSGRTAGFTWDSFVLDPVERHAELLGRAVSLGARIVKQRLRRKADVFRLARHHHADVIVDALGLGSRIIFEDDRIAGRTGHLLVAPNLTGDRRVVMDDDGLAYVISGPRFTYIGGTYIDIEASLLAEADLRLHDEDREHLLRALAELRPDLILDKDGLQHQVGIRPVRVGGARLEQEEIAGLPPVIHATGFGGSGWSVFVGVANDVADMIIASSDWKTGGRSDAQTPHR